MNSLVYSASVSFASLQWKFHFPRIYPNFWPNSSVMIDLTSDKKDRPWFYFISSTSLVNLMDNIFFRVGIVDIL
jgi:hypothetical protein